MKTAKRKQEMYGIKLTTLWPALVIIMFGGAISVVAGQVTGGLFLFGVASGILLLTLFASRDKGKATGIEKKASSQYKVMKSYLLLYVAVTGAVAVVAFMAHIKYTMLAFWIGLLVGGIVVLIVGMAGE